MNIELTMLIELRHRGGQSSRHRYRRDAYARDLDLGGALIRNRNHVGRGSSHDGSASNSGCCSGSDGCSGGSSGSCGGGSGGDGSGVGRQLRQFRY